jgi:hypothetical protein
MNIEGVVRQLPIYEPPIDPALLVRAAAAGVDISSTLNDINAALPHYRFSVMLQKATELCNDVKTLGAALLSALEKRDAEALALLRSGHEIKLLDAVRQIKDQQISEANAALEGLYKSKEAVNTRYEYYRDIKFISEWEVVSLGLMGTSLLFQALSTVITITSSGANLVPSSTAGVSGVSTPVATVTYGGKNVADAVKRAAEAVQSLAGTLNTAASMSSTYGSYWRRWDDWKLQEQLAFKELEQLDKQIAAAKICIAIAEQDLKNHDLQTENAKAVDTYMRQKYTNQELYDWMVGQIASLYFQSYQLAYDVAKRAERAYRYELGLADSDFIQFGYWDSLKKGLLAGERLHYDLKRMDVAYLDQNKREYEITKHISLMMLDPVALIKLKETGECFVNIPEVLFDLDYAGHYMRRIKSVSLTIPCVTGPYTSVNCTLTLLKHSVRRRNILDNGQYQRRGGDDLRFADSAGAIQSIVTSSAQNDSGMFEPNLRDERYLAFEGAGAISEWRVELPKDFKQFDYATISDIVLHMRYTARDGGEVLKQTATAEMKAALDDILTLAEDRNGFFRMFSLRHEFPSEWHRFLNPSAGTAVDQLLTLTLTKERFPFLFQDKNITIEALELFAKVRPEFAATHNESTLQLSLKAGTAASADVLPLAPWNGLLRAAKTPAGQPGNWTLTAWLDMGGGKARLDPSAIQDIAFVCHYSLKNL